MVDPSLLAGIGGAIGAVLRYLVGTVIGVRTFPVHTLTVNVLGSFLLGAIMFFPVSVDAMTFVGAGICGAFTTFSTFSVDTVQLWEEGERRMAGTYAIANVVLSLGAVGLAGVLAGAISI